jgi:hypothetical protein
VIVSAGMGRMYVAGCVCDVWRADVWGGMWMWAKGFGQRALLLVHQADLQWQALLVPHTTRVTQRLGP